MRVLVSWLRDFVDVSERLDDLAHMLSMRGFEVAAIEAPPSGPLLPNGSASSLPDAVIDLEITANRPDCMSVLGIAREVSTAYDRPRKNLRLIRKPHPVEPPADPEHASASENEAALGVTIEDPALCPRYAAAVAEVRIGPSPPWMANRLAAAGIRPINNIVDVTNYVLIELGHPMHAFDLDRLAGRELRIRQGRSGERLRTLDGEVRDLAPGMLAIADARRPQAIGGVIGGQESEVGSGTRWVAFESAYFNPTSVRRTSKRLGLKTEASARFERGADISAPVWALKRACVLMEEIGAGRLVGELIDRYPEPRPITRVPFRQQSLKRHLGQPIDQQHAARILGSLGFTLEDTISGWDVSVPSFRVDVTREIDLIEEVARHYGYDRLPETFPILREVPKPSDPRIAIDRLIRRVLTGAGFFEAVTFSFLEAEPAQAFAPAPEVVAIARPLSEKFAVLRPSLLPGILESVSYNRRREQRDVRLFEIGRRFTATGGETRAAGLAWIGAGTPDHWSAGTRPVDFFDMRGVVERLCGAMGMEPDFRRADEARAPYLVAGRRATVTTRRGTELGVLGQLRADVAEALDLPRADEIYVAEIDLDTLTDLRPTQGLRVEPLPRFPSIVRDVSIIVDERLPAASVRATILTAAPQILTRVEEFDRYQGPGIPEGRISLSLHLTFRAPNRTLTDAEVDEAMANIVAALERARGAVRR